MRLFQSINSTSGKFLGFGLKTNNWKSDINKIENVIDNLAYNEKLLLKVSSETMLERMLMKIIPFDIEDIKSILEDLDKNSTNRNSVNLSKTISNNVFTIMLKIQKKQTGEVVYTIRTI